MNLRCPKCKLWLQDSGAVRIGDMAFPTFECPQCVIETNELGVRSVSPVTFSVDRTGHIIDPATQQPPKWLADLGEG